MKTAAAKTEHVTSSRSVSPFFQKGGKDGLYAATDKPFFHHQPIQTKLTIGHPHDKYEQEADAMADQVVQRLSTPETVQTKPISTAITPFLQTKCALCDQEEKLQKKDEEEDKGLLKNKNLQRKPIFESNVGPPDDENVVQRKCAECAEEADNRLQAKSENKSLQSASGSIENSLSYSKGTGSTLPENTRAQMESSFGIDFSEVRIHDDMHAVQINKALGAQAFTNGSDIYFNTGKYNADSNSGKQLLAHELTHVVQQGGPGIRTKSEVNNPGNKFLSTPEPVIQGFDIPFTDYETDFSWSGVKTAAGLVGSGAKKAGKWVYNRGKFIVGNAWECAKATGASTYKLVTGDFDSITDLIGMKRPTGVGPSMVDWISFVLTHPCIKMIPGYEAVAYVVDKFASAGKFLKGAWHMVNNPGEITEAIRTSPVLTGMMNGISTSAMERALKAVTFSSPAADIVDGIWRHLQPKIEYFLANWWDIVKSTAWDLLWPWPGVGKDLSAIWGLLGDCVDNLWDLDISDAVDNILEIWRTVNNMLGRLYLWFVIASVIIGAIIGAFFGGAGAVPGALLGLKFAMLAGQYLLVSTIAAEVASIGKAGYDLVFTQQSVAERERDFEQISNSALTLAITGIMAALSAMAVRFAKGVISRVAGLFQQVKGGAGGTAGGIGGGTGGGGSSGGQSWTPRVIQGGKGTGGGTGPVAQGGVGGQYPVVGNNPLKVQPVPVIEPPTPNFKIVPKPAPAPVKAPAIPANTGPVVGGVTGAQTAKKLKEKQEEADKKKIYQWQTPFEYQGRNGQVNYSGPTIPGVIYIPNGHHVWPEVLGGDPAQTLMTVITTIHNEEIHYGRSPVNSPVIALYGSIYNYVTNYLNNSQTFGPNGSNVLQGRRLTHTGGTGSANQLLITAMSAGTAQAARLAAAVRQAMTQYYGFFRALSNPQIPYTAYRQGLDDSYDYIV